MGFKISEARCCADYVNEVINNGIGKFLLFAHHRKMLDSLEAVLKERVGGGGYMRIDGSTPQRERADLVTRFQEEMGFWESHLICLGLVSHGVTIAMPWWTPCAQPILLTI